MPSRTKSPGSSSPVALEEQVKAVVAKLKRLGSQKGRDGMARFAIPSDKAFGVSVATLQKLAKEMGRDHALALALWEAGWYEARMLAALIDEPARVTPAQMDRWCREFDNWAVCDNACFHLFDRTPHAWKKVEQWSRREGEFPKRAAFALLASLALHDKKAGDESFLQCLPLAEAESDDERNFVKKAVVWALRGVAGRNPALNAVATEVAKRLADSDGATKRWVGMTVLRELSSAASQRRLAKQRKAEGKG
jgi:3-methyladenine DNA glycosylase AlkD